jgi:hypothetical protein
LCNQFCTTLETKTMERERRRRERIKTHVSMREKVVSKVVKM